MNFKLDNNFNIQNTSFVFLTWSSMTDRKSTRLNSSHMSISYAVFCLKKKIEIVALTERCSYYFRAAVGIDQARDRRHCDLVGIVNPIRAAELILAEDAAEIEIFERRVEHRQLSLIAKWYVEIVQPRLQRLQKLLTSKLDLTIEAGAAVNTENGQR